MSTHPFLPLYVDDYEAATAHLSVEEDGIYSRLLRLCWRTPGCSLPDDHAWIARKIRVSEEVFARVAKAVLDEFFKPSRGRLVQRRLKAEYDDISRKKTARKLAGKKGGETKALNTQRKSASNANDLLADTRASPKPEPKPEPEEEDGVVDWRTRLDEAHRVGTGGLDLTSVALLHARELRALCEPLTGEPCQWDEVLDAILMCASRAKARGSPMRSWAWVKTDALALRDKRLNANLPDPRQAHERPAPHSPDRKRAAFDERLRDIDAAMEAAFEQPRVGN